MTKRTDTKPLRAKLEKASAAKGSENVYDLLERQRPELETALPKGLSVDRFTRTILTELERNPALLECSPNALLGAMLLAAQLGLEPGPLGLVYLVPHAPAVDFVIGYRGYIDLAYRSGHVRDIAAVLVYEGEPFAYRKGTRPFLDHEPGPRETEANIEAAYAVARLKSGGTVFEVIYEADWERARQASTAGSQNDGPWATDRAAMIRKTAVRRLEPMLPKSLLLTRAAIGDESHAPEPAELADEGETL
jgi:recombination protein RecT